MTKESQNVKKFMLAFKQECPSKPIQIDEKTAKLRAKLILEEAFETIVKGLGLEVVISDGGINGDFTENFVTLTESVVDKKLWQVDFLKFKEVDLVELADGVSDVLVVTEGTAIACGIDSEPIHEAVSNSNLSKFWTTKEIESSPIAKDLVFEAVDDDKFIARNSDGKITKSPGYISATPLIEEILKAQSK